jgi:hypothetical protein
MVAPQNTCTTTEQRGIVRFLWAKDMAAKDIHKEMDFLRLNTLSPSYDRLCLHGVVLRHYTLVHNGMDYTKLNHKEMLPMYSEHCQSRQAVHNWVQKFSEGQKSIEGEHRAVCACFRQQPQEFYATGFQGLVKRWDKCLNLYGDYVEK